MKVEFDPRNKIVKLCLQGMALELENKVEEASAIFNEALNIASNDFERYLASYYIANNKEETEDKLLWFEKVLKLAQSINDIAVSSALPRIYFEISKCYEDLSNTKEAMNYLSLSNEYDTDPRDSGPFYHGTRADLSIGDMLVPGGMSNYKENLKMNHIYFSALMNGAALAAGLAKGDNPERIYIVEPTGVFENDPNVTNVKFPGNPTRSYRSSFPLKIIGEINDWKKQSSQELENWKEKIKNNKGKIIN